MKLPLKVIQGGAEASLLVQGCLMKGRQGRFEEAQLETTEGEDLEARK